jgi:hypothetical protein
VAGGDEGDRSRRLALAVLSILVEEDGGEEGAAARLAALRDSLTPLPSRGLRPYWAGGQVVIAFEDLAEAAATALSLAAAGHRVGGHYLVAAPFSDPFSDTLRLATSATAAAAAAAASTPPGSVCVTDDFASALAVAGEAGPLSEFVGELDAPDGGPPVGLYALKPRPR